MHVTDSTSITNFTSRTTREQNQDQEWKRLQFTFRPNKKNKSHLPTIYKSMHIQWVPLPCPCHIFSDFIALYNTSQKTSSRISALCHALWGCSCLYTISRGKMSSFRCFTLTLDREPEDVLPQLTCMQSSASQCS